MHVLSRQSISQCVSVPKQKGPLWVFFLFSRKTLLFYQHEGKNSNHFNCEKQKDMSLLLPLINVEGMGSLIQCHLQQTQNARVGDQVTWSLQTLTSYEGISSAGPQKLPTHYMNTD